jgi:type I restriction enzyme R subunit
MNELVPYAQLVEERYAGWLLQQQNLGVEFTDNQKWWLDRIKDAISQSAQFDIKDLDLSPFSERGGTDGALKDIGESILGIVSSLNESLAS